MNISTSVMSERTDRSFYGNPDEDLAHIVRTMTEAFPRELAKCKDGCTIAQAYCITKWPLFLSPPSTYTVEAASMGDGLLSAATQVSRNFSSYSQELMGK